MRVTSRSSLAAQQTSGQSRLYMTLSQKKKRGFKNHTYKFYYNYIL